MVLITLACSVARYRVPTYISKSVGTSYRALEFRQPSHQMKNILQVSLNKNMEKYTNKSFIADGALFYKLFRVLIAMIFS